MARPQLYTIRPVKLGEAKIGRQLAQMHEKCFPDDPILNVQGGGWLWFAYDPDDRPVAFGMMKKSIFYPDTRVYLNRAGVMPRARGEGLQRRLVQVRVQKARRLGFKEVVTDTLEGNFRSANNLIECGFRLYWPKEGQRLCAQGSVYFRRDL